MGTTRLCSIIMNAQEEEVILNQCKITTVYTKNLMSRRLKENLGLNGIHIINMS